MLILTLGVTEGHAEPLVFQTQGKCMADDSSITHITDTAFWTATFRAREAQRADAAFHDALAGILSGERGRKITRSMPRAGLVGWGIVVRTSAIDQLIHEALDSGVDAVLNLGAGLDTRPYRMKLPGQLRWIEIDFPNIVEFKNASLAEHAPICHLERIGMDLLNRSARSELFARCGAYSEKTLVITEGVISYLSNDDVATLAREMFENPAIRLWIQDFDNAGNRQLPRGWEEKLRAAPFVFEVKDWFEFFEQSGWRALKTITSAEEAKKISRPYPWDFPYGLLLRALPSAMREKILSLSGAVLMERM
jgi:methyltransferase (TIGR00027 family)